MFCFFTFCVRVEKEFSVCYVVDRQNDHTASWTRAPSEQVGQAATEMAKYVSFRAFHRRVWLVSRGDVNVRHIDSLCTSTLHATHRVVR